MVALLLGDLAGNTVARPGPGTAAHDELLGQTKLEAELTNLVLEQHAQRLDDLFEVNIIWKAANVVMALDDGGFAEAGL